MSSPSSMYIELDLTLLVDSVRRLEILFTGCHVIQFRGSQSLFFCLSPALIQSLTASPHSSKGFSDTDKKMQRAGGTRCRLTLMIERRVRVVLFGVFVRTVRVMGFFLVLVQTAAAPLLTELVELAEDS